MCREVFWNVAEGFGGEGSAMTSSGGQRYGTGQATSGFRTAVSSNGTSGPGGRNGGWHFGEAVRDARERARLTQEQLGQHLGYSRTAVSRLESSANPRLSPRVLVRICAALDRTPAQLLGQAAEREDPVKRRQFMHLAPGTAIGAGMMPLDPGAVGAADSVEIERGIEQLRQLDQRTGGDRLGLFAERLVRDTQRLLRGSYGEATGTRLYALLGEACLMAGWLAQDSGDPDHAVARYTEGLSAAHMADDHLLCAHACANLSMAARAVGQPARAVQCARAGLRSAYTGRGGPRLVALLHAREAAGLAVVGDTTRAHDAIRSAQEAMDGRRGPDQPWTDFLTPEEFSGLLGYAYRQLGEHRLALRCLATATGTPDRPRNAAGWRLWLAGAHAEAGDPAAAASIATSTVPQVLELSSTRIRQRVGELDRELSAHSRVAEVADFRDLVADTGVIR